MVEKHKAQISSGEEGAKQIVRERFEPHKQAVRAESNEQLGLKIAAPANQITTICTVCGVIETTTMTYLEDGCVKPVIEMCLRNSSWKKCGKMMVQLTAATIKEVKARNCLIKLQGVVMDSSQLQQLVQKGADRPTITRHALQNRGPNFGIIQLYPSYNQEKNARPPANKQCRREGCDKWQVKKGYCTAHGPTILCNVEGCDKTKQRKGYCTRHWNALK